MRISITICPKCVKSLLVSTTINPVTQVAEVEVNRASQYDNDPEFVLAWGSQRSIEPVKIAKAKLNKTILGGELKRNVLCFNELIYP